MGSGVARRTLRTDHLALGYIALDSLYYQEVAGLKKVVERPDHKDFV